MRRMIRYGLAAAVILAAGFAAKAQTFVDAAATGADDGSSWADAYTDLQTALTLPSPPSEIWVAAGTYKPTTGASRSSSFSIDAGVSVYGGFLGNATGGGETERNQRNPEVNLTILDGDIGTQDDSSDNVFHVVSFMETNNTTFFSGFTIRNGNADGSGTDAFGGGIFISAGDETVEGPRLNRLRVINNTAEKGGGGMYVENVSPALANCLFENNTVTDGDGGAVYVDLSPRTIFQNCVFNANQALCESEGCAGRAGGVRVTGKKTFVWLLGCALGQNTAQGSGSAAYTDAIRPNGNDYSLALTNSIAWLNSPPDQIDGTTLSQISVWASNIEDGTWTDPENISADPRFRLSGPRVLSYRFGSPCFDAGNNLGIDSDRTNVDDDPNTDFAIPWDFQKHQRIKDPSYNPCDPNSFNNPIVDMGAYELCDLPDVDGEGSVGLTDLALLLTCFGLNPCSGECCWGDMNNDQDVDLDDLATLLIHFGASCPAFNEECVEDRPAPPDPLTEWLRSADPADVLEWWESGGSESLTPP